MKARSVEERRKGGNEGVCFFFSTHTHNTPFIASPHSHGIISASKERRAVNAPPFFLGGGGVGPGLSSQALWPILCLDFFFFQRGGITLGGFSFS